ncbi:MAG: hypothetical protein PHU04_01130 [Candidatus Peribacteraceae bacterium]|nr:hypothetical protein [Candidatus Peribacteraceae bacterium]
MKVSKSDLSVVQNLYLLQVDLAEFLHSDLSDPQERRVARERMREFSSLLRQADWRYMGGEDVLDSLKDVQQQIVRKINSPQAAKKQVASPARKTASKKAKTVPKKKLAKKVHTRAKPAAKKKTAAKNKKKK